MKKLLAISLTALLLLTTSVSAFAINYSESIAYEAAAPIGNTSEISSLPGTSGSGTGESALTPTPSYGGSSSETGQSQTASSAAEGSGSPISQSGEPAPAALSPLAAFAPTLTWSDGSSFLNTGVLTQNLWSNSLIFEYPVANADVPVGGLVFTIDMGAEWPGTLSLGTNSYFSISSMGNGIWQFSNTQVLTAESTLTTEIGVSLDGQVRNLPVGLAGTILFGISLSYTDPDTPTPEALPPLSLSIATKNDTIAVSKAIKTVDTVPAPGLASANYPDLLTHNFVNWELSVSGTTNTRGFAPGLELTDAIPYVGAGMGSVVSVRAGSTFLYKEGDPYPSNSSITLDASGNLKLTPPAAGTTYSIIVKYPRANFPTGLLAVQNTADINGYYVGEPGPARILSTSITPATDIIPSDGSPGKFSPDVSKAYSLSITRTRPMGNGGGSGYYGGDIFPRNKINGTQAYTFTVNKGLPGNPANPSGSADVAVYIDVFTYEKNQLDATQLSLTALKVGGLAGSPVTSAVVYFKDSVSGSWSSTGVSPDASGNVTVPANTLYAKVVYKDISGTGSATITATYQPTSLLISQVESGAVNSEAVLGVYAGVGVFDAADGTTSLFPEIPKSNYPVKIISKVNIWPPADNPLHINLLEYMDTYNYKEAEPGVSTLRAVAGTRVCDWLFVANNTYSTVNWQAAGERFEFTSSYLLDMTNQQGSPVKGFTFALYLPENIFLDTSKIHDGDFLANYNGGEFTNGGKFYAGQIETTMVSVNGVQRQRVVIPIELWEDAAKTVPGSWQSNGNNSRINLPFYTEDMDRYKSGTAVTFSTHTVVPGFAGLDGRFNGTGGSWAKDKNNSSVTWDGAKLTNRDNSIEDWMRTDNSTVTIPNNITTTFSGVRKYLLDDQNNPVLSGTVPLGKTWKYRIEIVSNEGHLRDVVVYDILPASGDTFLGSGNSRGSQFTAYLLDVDLSSLPANRQPIVYYSTNPTPDKNLAGSDWSIVPPPSADIRALAFDFGSAEFIGSPGSPDKAAITLTMGSGNDPALINKTVLNNLYSSYNIRRGTGNYAPIVPRDSAAVRATVIPPAANYATISAILFQDENNDGILNGSDTGLANRPVGLYLNGTDAANLVDQTTTSYNGSFLFTVDANPGNYYVGFTSQGNEKFSPFTAATGIYTNVNPATINGSAAFTDPLAISAGDITANTVFDRANAGLSLWYGVTYDANGGANPPVDTGSPYLAGSSVQVKGAGSMARSGYEWVGWNTRADGTGTAYTQSSLFTITGDVTLYAQWKISSPSSSSAPPPSSIPASSSSAPPPSSIPASSSNAPASSGATSSSSAASSQPVSSGPPAPPPSSPSSAQPVSSRPTSRPASSSSSISSGVSSAPASSSASSAVSSSSSSTSSAGINANSGSGGTNSTSGTDGTGNTRTFADQTGNLLFDLFNNKIPLGNTSTKDAWSLLNLVMSLIGVIIALVLAISYFVNRRRQNADTTSSRRQNPPIKRNILLRWLAAGTGILTMILFLILENLTLPYVFINHWTPIIAIVFIIHLVLLAVFNISAKRKQEDAVA